MVIQHTLGSFPGLRFVDAMQAAIGRPDLGGVNHVQLCPQNFGTLDAVMDDLKAISPETIYRLHANVRVEGHDRHFDASTQGDAHDAYFRRLGEISRSFGAAAYTLHAGEREGRPVTELVGRIKRIEDLMGIRVGVEGHYPEKNDKWWLSSWEEYRWLHESGLDFALDLSHLHIVATKERCADVGLVREMLTSEHCIEVHLSGNDGISDSHVRLADCPTYWWHAHLDAINEQAIVFYEGNEMRGENATERMKGRLARKSRIEILN